jgi:conjugal transfer/entry exclusion protein
MKKNFAAFVAVALVAAALIFATISIAQTPKAALPPVDTTNGPLIAQATATIAKVNAQIAPLTAQINTAKSTRNMAEQAALAAAHLDACKFAVTPDGKSFFALRSASPNCH